MPHKESMFTRLRTGTALWISAAAWLACSAVASAQTPVPDPVGTPPPPAAGPSERYAPRTPATPTAAEAEPSAEDFDTPPPGPRTETMGGMPEGPRGEYYTSPLKTIGIGMGGGSYVLSAGAGLFYLVFVYPLQALFGSNKVEPVMLWMLLPIIGPWMAQYEDLVKDQPFWRGVLIADAGLQATGLVLGLIGAALSGRRDIESESTGLELKVGVAGGGMLGMTVSLRTL
jgi:hypothetical protein